MCNLVLICLSKFFNNNKVFTNLQVLIYTKLHEKSCYSEIIYMRNTTESQEGWNFDSMLFAVWTQVTTLYLCYMKCALVFSQSGTQFFNLFSYTGWLIGSAVFCFYEITTDFFSAVNDRFCTNQGTHNIWYIL